MSVQRTDVQIRSLRDALAMLRQEPGQLVETDVVVDPEAELSGVYRYVGAGGAVQRPTAVDGPAMLFHNVKGFPDASVVIGVLASRARVALLEKAMPGKVKNVYAHRAGGGKYMAVLQVVKTTPTDEGRQRQAALLAFSAFPELKHVILVDDDVDIFDTNDVLWALNTRYQGNLDTVFLPGVRCHPLDPSAGPEYNASIPDHGVSCKTIFDCTVPFAQKARFARAKFMDVDPRRWLPDWKPV